MKIKYIGVRARDVEPTSATGGRPFHVEPGQVVDVDDKTAQSLLDQTGKWEKAPDPKPAKIEKES